MTERSRIILAIFAHPDDEIGAGSTLAFYASRGVKTILVCATRGEAATIFCEDCATRETLALVRTGELQCACDHLGISELRWLDWPDGGIGNISRDRAVAEIVALIRDVRPDIVLTHPENGLYPHPDHLAVWEIVREAFDASGAAAGGPGEAWSPSRLFTRAMPQSILDRAPALKEFRVELNGQLLPFIGIPDDEIDVRMQVGEFVPRRMAAWDCHRSQHNPKGFSTTMPDGLRQEMAETETFLLVAGLPLPLGVTDDFFAGLEAAQAALVPESAPVEPADETTGAGDPAFITGLQSELGIARAVADLAQDYLKRLAEQKYAASLRHVGDQMQDIMYLLARSLRIAGEPPADVPADRSLLRAGNRPERPEQQVRFLLSQLEQGAQRYGNRAGQALDPGQRALWSQLATALQSAAAALAASI